MSAIDEIIRKVVLFLTQSIPSAILKILNWKQTNEEIKNNHLKSMVEREYFSIKKEKNSILEHIGLDEKKQQQIHIRLLENITNSYKATPQQFDAYYSKRTTYIRRFLVGAIIVAALATIVVKAELNQHSIQFWSENDQYGKILSSLFENILTMIAAIIFVLGERFASKAETELSTAIELISGYKIRLELKKAIRFELREILNNLYFSLQYRTVLDEVSGAGLEEGYDPLLEVDTAARNYVQRMIRNMKHGSFGVAGPRGTGKTTLLRSMQEQEEQNTIYVHISAPVAYEAREFILYLYAEICRAVANRLDPHGKERPYVGGKWSLRNFFRGVFRWEIILAAIIMAIVVFYRSGVVMEYYQDILKSYNIDADVLDIILKYNFLLVFLAFLILVFFFNLLSGAFKSIFLYLFPETKNRQTTLKRSYNELQKIKYQQTLSDAKGGKLNLSIFEASSDQSSTFQEYEMSLPEVTSAYRKFIAEMVGRYRFIIAIDEMDKIENPLQAQAFLNDLKDILNLENCFYLVSVSENAMSAFELRGLPFRDAFDSTFDEVVHLNYIDLKQSRDIISRRLIGFPEPFLQLAYALSGGLPRDLIRVTRKMVMSVNENNPAPHLRNMAYTLLRDDLVNKINAVRHQVQEKGLNIKAGSYMLGLDLLENNISVDNLIKHGKNMVKSAKGFSQKNGFEEIQALFYNLGIYMLYISTLLAFFTQDRTEDEFYLASDNHLNQLVTARQRIGLSSDYALILINQFRKTFRMPVVKV